MCFGVKLIKLESKDLIKIRKVMSHTGHLGNMHL